MNSYQEKDNKSIKLQVHKVDSSYENLEVLKDINLHVNEGEFVSILGPSGCGKSTLFHHIAGLVKPDGGNVYIDGRDVTGLTDQVSYMYQKDLLLPWRRIIDNVSLPLEVKGMKKKERREKVAPFFRIFELEGFENYYPTQLSGGMKQRVALMRTYMSEHEIMLLDEPFGRLDAMTKHKMQTWLLKVAKSMKRTILFITHDVEEAVFLSDRVYILSNRPATVTKEVICDFEKADFLTTTTSGKFNEIKAEILEHLGSLD